MFPALPVPITYMATFADMPSAGWGHVGGCEEPSMATWWAYCISINFQCPGTHISLILLCSSSFTKDWCQSHTNLEFICKLSSALMTSWLSEKDVDVSTYLALFCIPHYTSLNGIYFSLKYSCVEPKTKALPLSWAPVSVPVLVLDPSLYQTRPPLLSGCNPFSHSHLSGNLWCACLGSIPSNPICSMVLCSISQDFLVWPKLVDVGLHCWVHISFRSPPGPPPQSYLHQSCWGHLHLPCYSQTAWYL